MLRITCEYMIVYHMSLRISQWLLHLVLLASEELNIITVLALKVHAYHITLYLYHITLNYIALNYTEYSFYNYFHLWLYDRKSLEIPFLQHQLREVYDALQQL
ncbi:hypothetical protein X975_23117, partial [Stegodyphus mimosarum]